MTKRLTILAILVVLAAPAWAGGLGIGGSFWSTDEADDGSGLGVRLSVDLTDNLDFDLHVGFIEELLLDVPGAPRVDLEATPIDLGVSYGFGTSTKVTPRVGGGLSYVLYDAQGARVDSEIDDEVGFYGLLGVDFMLGSKAAIYLEGLYRTNVAEIRDFGLTEFDRAKFTTTGAAANVGIMFTW